MEPAAPAPVEPETAGKQDPGVSTATAEALDPAPGEEQPSTESVQERSSKRNRQPVARLSVAAASPVKKKLEIPQGEGTPISDIPNICLNLERHKAESFSELHRLLFGTRGKNAEIKKHIRSFSGFPADEDLDKKREWLGRHQLKDIKEMCQTLDIETSGSKENVVERLVTFLKAPKASGKRHPLERKREGSARKMKKSGAGKNAGKKTQAGKQKRASKVSDPLTSLMYYAIDVKRTTESEHPEMDTAAIMNLIREKFDALSAEEKQVYEAKAARDQERYNKELKAAEAHDQESENGADEDSEEDQDDETDNDEDFEPAPKKQKKVAAKRPASEKKKRPISTAKAEASDESDASDDDVPLSHKVKQTRQPDNSELKDAVTGILQKADLDTITKKIVRTKVEEMYPNVDLSDKKAFINSCIDEALKAL